MGRGQLCHLACRVGLSRIRICLYLNPLCAIFERFEQEFFCSSQPRLPAKLDQFVEKSGPAILI